MKNDKLFTFDKGTQTITGYDVSKGGTDVRVPDNIEGVKVLHIGDGAFANMRLMSLVVPDSLFSIGKGVIYSNNIESISVNTDVKLEMGIFYKEDCDLEAPFTWGAGNKKKREKGYNRKEYRGVLSRCGLNEDNLPDGVRIEGSHGDWWIVDSRTTYDADNEHYNVKPLGFNTSEVCIVCPNCKEVHWHGAPIENRDSYLGFRTPHCFRDVPKKLPYNILKG